MGPQAECGRSVCGGWGNGVWGFGIGGFMGLVHGEPGAGAGGRAGAGSRGRGPGAGGPGPEPGPGAGAGGPGPVRGRGPGACVRRVAASPCRRVSLSPRRRVSLSPRHRVSVSPRLLFALLAAVSLARAGTFYVTVTGLGGEPDYEQRFAMWGREIDGALRRSGERVETLTAPRQEQVSGAFCGDCAGGQERGRAGGDDHRARELDGKEYKFNLPGPDLTGGEIAALMDGVPASRPTGGEHDQRPAGESIEAFPQARARGDLRHQVRH